MDLGELLDDIYRRYGRLTPEIVVEEARPKTSPLHTTLTWDNRRAGDKYRLIEAATLIRSVKVTYVTPRETEDEIGAWRAVRTHSGERTYMPVEEVAADATLTALHKRDMERQWRAMLARFQRFEEFRTMVLRDLGDTG